MFLNNISETTASIRYVRILKLCLVALGFVVLLLLLNGTENAEADTVVSGPVSNSIYPLGWNNASSPYWVEGDIWIPPGETLDIDGGGGPVDIRFNGSYSFKVGLGSPNPDSMLNAQAHGNPITFTRNSTGILWQGIEFTDSTLAVSTIEGAIIEYTSGGPDAAVWVNGPSFINIINCEIREVTGGTRAAGILLYHQAGTLITDNNNIIGNYIHNVTTLVSGVDAAGICLINTSANTLDDNTIENISAMGGGGGASGIYQIDSSYNNLINNDLFGIQYGLDIINSTTISIGNNTINNNNIGIYITRDSTVILYNNEICDNVDSGLWMDETCSGTWIVDQEAKLVNNPARLNGTLKVLAEKLSFFNVSTTYIGQVSIGIAGIFELCDSPASVISEDVWVDGVLYINSSKWQINVTTDNGEYGIQVNSTGTMIVQDNGTGPSEVTDGPWDNDGGTLGFDDFRYYFKVLTGATFRLLDSEVSEVGWTQTPADITGLYIATSNSEIKNSHIKRSYFGLWINGGGWTVENATLEELDGRGITIDGPVIANTVIANSTINTSGDSSDGIFVNHSSEVMLIGNTIRTLGVNSLGINLNDSNEITIRGNTINTTNQFADGILLTSSDLNTVENNNINASLLGSSGINITNSQDNFLANNTIVNATYGIYLNAMFKNTIFNNTLIYNDYGIYLSAADNQLIWDNKVWDNDYGIAMTTGCEINIIEANEIRDNMYEGISLQGSTSITIGNNTIYNNDYGIRMTSTSAATFYNNDIYDNPSWGIWMGATSSGNWYVDVAVTFRNNDGLVNGDLTVMSTGNLIIKEADLQIEDVLVMDMGSLEVKDSPNTIISQDLYVEGPTTLDNSTWEINCSFHGEYKIQVNATGDLVVFNGSLITVYDINYRYNFWVNGSATFLNSTIEYAGYSLIDGSMGVRVTTDTVMFDNITLRYCMVGIVVSSANPTIKNIMVHNCSIAIALMNGDTLTITNVTIWNITNPPMLGPVGIYADTYNDLTLVDINIDGPNPDAVGIMFVDSTGGQVSDSTILNLDTGIDLNNSEVTVIYTDIWFNENGIRVENGSTLTVQHCNVSNSVDTGIAFEDSGGTVYNCTVYANGMHGVFVYNSAPTIDSCMIYGPNQDFSVYCVNGGSPYVVNSTLSSDLADFVMDSNSHPVSLNNTFDNSTVSFNDALSTLTVQWFLHVRVEDLSAVGISGANVSVTDNENGTFDSSYVTDSGGYVNWIVVTEYIQDISITTYYTPYTISAWNDTKFGIKMGYISESMLIIVTLDTDFEVSAGKIVDNTTVKVGEYITYTFWYNNTGLFNLTQVYINDTFDLYLIYISDTSGISPDILGDLYSWYLGNVTPGNHSFDVHVMVNSGVANGTVLQNNFTFYYSDADYVPQTPIFSNFVSSTILASQMTIEKFVENGTV
ncbi:MAG: right-handed parallel beta-helix repeat-containing protein, partial [Methanomassiliicoccales archaeon]